MRCHLLGFALVLGVLGCSSQEDLTMVTYNAGLSTLFVDHTEERAPLIADAVANLDADVVCLQEVWEQEHVDAIIAAASHLPHVAVIAPDQEIVPGSCDADAIAPLAACVAAACSDPPAADCILDNCSTEFEAQDGDCAGCLASSLGGTLDEIQTGCTSETSRYQYDGSFGVMLLSAAPFIEHPHIDLGGTLSRRGAIHVEYDDGPHVLCTHLTAVEPLPYPGSSGSWKEDQRVQIDEVTSFVANTDDTPVVLLGDLNTGPDEVSDHFGMLLETGLAGALTNTCTFCADNPLVDDATPSVLIDHVLVRDGEATATRILDQEVDIGGSPSALSDHYGVRAVISIQD